MFRWRPRRHILGGRIWPVGSRALGERCRLASSAGSSLAPPPDRPLPCGELRGGREGGRASVAPASWACARIFSGTA
jgi:hypothetical protein